MPNKTLRKFGRWIGAQADGFLGGIARLASTPLRNLLPGTAWSTLKWVGQSLSWSVGTSTASRMIVSSFALLIAAIVSSSITLGATIPLVIFFGITMLVGFARLIPVVDRAFVGVRDALIPR